MNSLHLILLMAALLLVTANGAEGGILRGRRKDDDSVETLLAVGLIAKALSDTEKQCPPPVTKIIHVPVHTERVYIVKEKDHHAWSESTINDIWKEKPKVKF